MVMRWIDGGETWGTTTYTSRAYLSGSVGTATPGRISPGQNYLAMNGSVLVTPSLGVQNTWVIGFGFYASSVPTTDRIKIAGLSGASQQFHLDLYENGSDMEWRLYRGATLIGTSTTFVKNVWHYFELKVTARTATNGSYELRRNETNILSGSGVNLANVGSDGVDGFHVGSTDAVAWRLDDMYILDSSGASNNDFKGDSVMFEVLPDGDGHQNDMTRSAGATNYENVDDGALVSPDADYVSSDTIGHEDYYTFANAPGTGIGTIAAVKITCTARLVSTGARTLQPRYYNGTLEFDAGSDVTVDGTSFLELPSITDVNPDTGTAWTKSDLDGAEFGLEVAT